MSTVRVRFAPSPTGYLHVGGLRTALYNYLFARKHGGVFILRIEDTDRSRLVEGSAENLIATLRWAGLEFDEGPGKGGDRGPYIQSERLALYRNHAEDLVRRGRAYYAFDSEAELEEMKNAQVKLGVQPKYDRRALRLSKEEVRRKLDAGEPSVVRLLVPGAASVGFDDAVHGRVEFAGDLLDDQVLMKSDGYPTYHLANVVDDHMMGVTHVIRGEEWLSSTPKHVLLYESFGWEMPVFSHLPLLLNPDRSKLSKRQGDVAAEEYRRKGYLPEALVNFIALCGWNPGDDREFFTLKELEREFSIERVGKSGAIFNVEKLNFVNKHYMKTRSDADLAVRIRPLLEERGITGSDDAYLRKVIALLKERVTTLVEFAAAGEYFFTDPAAYDEKAVLKGWKPESGSYLRQFCGVLEQMPAFSASSAEESIRNTAAQLGIGSGKLIHPVRLALSGRGEGPGLFEMMEVLGRETCIRRLERAVNTLG